MRVLVDTNVFLDFLLNRPPFQKDSHDFFEYFLSHRHQIVASPMSFRDIEYLLRKVESDPNERKRSLHAIYSIVYKIIDIRADDVINDLFANHKDFEDGLLMESAERMMLDAIVTNNVSVFSDSPVPVFTPAAITEHLKKNEGH
ncbi:MAG: PIN domain-containing protein [Bacilli bacterium]|nr:PIN domain-containing protein [Bacilli bacterium]